MRGEGEEGQRGSGGVGSWTAGVPAGKQDTINKKQLFYFFRYFNMRMYIQWNPLKNFSG